MTGRLYGVGVGPGDPELMTLKAVRLIREADVVFCPAGSARARSTAAAQLEQKRVVALEMEMRGDRESALRAAAETVVRELAGGTGVYLTEGDPSLYSTFGLLAAELARTAPELEVQAVAGVSAITAAAAAAGVNLGLGDQSLAVLPASAPPAQLEDVLQTFDATVLLKPSMGGDLGELLQRLDLAEDSTLVQDASRPGQRVLRGGDALQARPPYFSTWLVPGRAPAHDRGRVHFVGAGPGAASQLTRRALALIRRAGLVVAADSLVAPEVIALARGRVITSSELTLEQLVPPMIEAAGRGELVVRLHSGDPSIYGAVAEQFALLRAAGCPYDVVPGVSSAFAAAAALGVELTEAGGSQTVVLTRHGKRVPIPERERLRELARHRSTLAVFLSAAVATEVQGELLEAGFDPETPAAVAYRISWPDEVLERTTVGEIGATVRRLGLRRHTLILVGDALVPGRARSRLYDSGHVHVHRRRSDASAPELPRPPALVAATPHGERLARRLQRTLPGATVLQDPHRLPELFSEGTPVVAFMAVGAAVRLLAPVLHDKRSEPPVVAVDDGGRYAVSLIGGRAAGANRLAAYVASVLGAEAVVTTAAERLGLPALDEALSVLGWRLEEPKALTRLEAAVVRGEEIGFFGPDLEPPAGFGFQVVESPAEAGAYALGLAVSDRLVEDLPAGWALARPGRLVLGFGCSTAATAEEALELAFDALRGAELSPSGVGVVATIDRRLDHPAARALAESLGARLVGFTPGQLDVVEVANPSPAVREAVGTGSVAEAAALLQSGGGLLVPKRVGARATVAVAE